MASSIYTMATIAVALLSFVFYRLYATPLSNIPGPPLAAVSRLWLAYHSHRGDMHRVMIDLHRRHGKLVRTGPNELSVSDLKAIKTIYGAGTKFRKSDWYGVWQGRRKFDLFPERDEKVHGNQRRLVSRIYAMESLKELEPYVDDAVSCFMNRISQIQDKVVDMGVWVQLFAFDVVGEVTFSKRFGFMDAGRDDGSFAAIDGALHSAAWVGQIPWVYWLNDYLTPFFGNHLGVGSRHGKLRTFAAQEIETRRTRGSDHQDILDRLSKVHQDKPTEMDESAVLSMATSNIFAGSDTTAISIRSILYHLCKNPGYKKRLIAEVDAAHQTGSLSDPVQLKEANELKFLQACMWEGLRCHPAVGMSLPRVTPEGGIEVDSRYIPEGTVVGVNPWVVHRDEAVFGSDTERFRPDRWIDTDTSDMERYFFAFGSGARVCLGRNLSWLEMSKLLPTFVLKFDFEFAEPGLEWQETCWWFVKQEGLYLKIRQR